MFTNTWYFAHIENDLIKRTLWGFSSVSSSVWMCLCVWVRVLQQTFFIGMSFMAEAMRKTFRIYINWWASYLWMKFSQHPNPMGGPASSHEAPISVTIPLCEREREGERTSVWNKKRWASPHKVHVITITYVSNDIASDTQRRGRSNIRCKLGNARVEPKTRKMPNSRVCVCLARANGEKKSTKKRNYFRLRSSCVCECV